MTTQIVFVGHHRDRLIESIRALRNIPFSRIILFTGEEDIPGEEKVRRIAEKMKRELSMVWDVEIQKINKRDVMKATAKLVEVIQNEKQNEVIINASGSLRTLAIAGYIAACITSSRIFTSIPRYNEKEEEMGIDEIIEIPTLPVDFPGKEQLEIISSLKEGVDSLDELVIRLNPEIGKEEEKFKKERSRLSHHIAKLERAGMVRKEREGRNVRIKLTGLGMLLTEKPIRA